MAGLHLLPGEHSESESGSGFARTDETSSCHRSLALSVEKEDCFHLKLENPLYV